MHSNKVIIHSGRDFEAWNLRAHFPDNAKAELMKLRKSQKITVVCRIEDVGFLAVNMDRVRDQKLTFKFIMEIMKKLHFVAAFALLLVGGLGFTAYEYDAPALAKKFFMDESITQVDWKSRAYDLKFGSVTFKGREFKDFSRNISGMLDSVDYVPDISSNSLCAVLTVVSTYRNGVDTSFLFYCMRDGKPVEVATIKVLPEFDGVSVFDDTFSLNAAVIENDNMRFASYFYQFKNSELVSVDSQSLNAELFVSELVNGGIARTEIDNRLLIGHHKNFLHQCDISKSDVCEVKEEFFSALTKRGFCFNDNKWGECKKKT